MDIQSLIEPISDSKDILVANSNTGWFPMDEQGKAFVKPLWSSSESGGWAVLFKWKAGFIAPAHKHLGSIHVFIASGKLKVRDQELNVGDYIYEPNGIIHDETAAIEDTVHINIGDGPILFFSEEGIESYFGWEQVAALRQAPAP